LDLEFEGVTIWVEGVPSCCEQTILRVKRELFADGRRRRRTVWQITFGEFVDIEGGSDCLE
jgi:hypothetical protein